MVKANFARFLSINENNNFGPSASFCMYRMAFFSAGDCVLGKNMLNMMPAHEVCPTCPKHHLHNNKKIA